MAAAGLVAVWLISGLDTLRGAAARNAGYLTLNQALSPRVVPAEESIDLTARAIAQLIQAVAVDPENESALRSLGYLYLGRGAEEKALETWKRTTGMAAELLDKGIAAEALDHTEEALAWYERATVVDPSYVEAWLRAGGQYEGAGDWAAAIDTYSAGMATVPDNSDLLFRLGRAKTQFENPVDWEDILALADRALHQDRYLHEWIRVQTHFLRGEALRGLGRQSEALQEYTLVNDTYPDDYWAALRRAEMFWSLGGDAEAAERYFQAAVAIDPGNKWAYHYLGRFYVAEGRPAEAQAQFEQILRIDPNDSVARQQLGQ